MHAQEKQETAVQKDRSAVAGSGSHESRCPQQSQFPSLQAKKGVKQLGSRIGNWLTSDQARLILQNADGVDLRSLRDLSMMAVLLGCGLRRAELSALEVEDLQIRQGHWAIVDLVGKGGHVRTVPMPMWVKEAVDRWMVTAKVSGGRIFRAVSRHGTSLIWFSGLKRWSSYVRPYISQFAGSFATSRVLKLFRGLVSVNPANRSTAGNMAHVNTGHFTRTPQI